jgi:hypothetical protein
MRAYIISTGFVKQKKVFGSTIHFSFLHFFLNSRFLCDVNAVGEVFPGNICAFSTDRAIAEHRAVCELLAMRVVISSGLTAH